MPMFAPNSGEERILPVDDEGPIRDLAQIVLRFTGFTVESAGTGPEALAPARSDAWNLLVLDVDLPGLDGFALRRTLCDTGDLVHRFGLRVEMQNDLAPARRCGTELPSTGSVATFVGW